MAPNSHHKEKFSKPNLDFVNCSPRPESTQVKCQSNSTSIEFIKANLEFNKANLEPNKTKLEIDKTKLEPYKTKLKADKTKLESNKIAVESIAFKLQSDKSKLKSGIIRLNSVDTNFEESMKAKLEPVKAKLESIVLKLESLQTEMESDKAQPDYVNVHPELGITEQDLSKTKLEPPQTKPDPGNTDPSETDPPEVPGIFSLITLWIEVYDGKMKLLEQWETVPMEVVMEHKTELKVWVEFGRWIRKNYIDQFLVEDVQRLKMVYDDWRQAPRLPWSDWTKTSRGLLRQFKHDSSCSTSSRCAYVCPSTKKDSLIM